MPLPPGTWKANVNGTETDLKIGGVAETGLFPVNFLNVDTQGFWNEASQTMTFGLVVIFVGGGGTGIVASFDACLFRSPLNPPPGRDVVATLAGKFRVSAGNLPAGSFPGIPTSRRTEFGWLAQITEAL